MPPSILGRIIVFSWTMASAQEIGDDGPHLYLVGRRDIDLTGIGSVYHFGTAVLVNSDFIAFGTYAEAAIASAASFDLWQCGQHD